MVIMIIIINIIIIINYFISMIPIEFSIMDRDITLWNKVAKCCFKVGKNEEPTKSIKVQCSVSEGSFTGQQLSKSIKYI